MVELIDHNDYFKIKSTSTYSKIIINGPLIDDLILMDH